MALTGVTKLFIWLTRFLQWAFAFIILGITAYFVHEFHAMGRHAPREVVVPLIFSILATIFTTFSIIALFFMKTPLQLLSAALDLILFVGFLASAGLLRRNYHILSRHNDLRNKLEFGRMQEGLRPHRARINPLVRLLAASVLIQLFLFFLTMLLQGWVAKKAREGSGSFQEKPSRSRFSRNTGRNEDYGAPVSAMNPPPLSESAASPYGTDPYASRV